MARKYEKKTLNHYATNIVHENGRNLRICHVWYITLSQITSFYCTQHQALNPLPFNKNKVARNK